MRQRPSEQQADDQPTVGVIRWRRRRLEQAGFEPRPAEQLASDPRVDLHAVLELIDRGCPPELAARILAPLEHEPKRWR